MTDSKMKIENGHKVWRNAKGKRHRTDGPAIEWANGYKAWYANGKLHRLDGPAFEGANGYKAWYVDGEELTENEFNEIIRKTINKDELFATYNRLTQDNQHGEALVILAAHLGMAKHRSILEHVNKIHEIEGYLPTSLNDYRCSLQSEIFKKAREVIGDAVALLSEAKLLIKNGDKNENLNLLVHNSMDGREAYETGERKLQ